MESIQAIISAYKETNKEKLTILSKFNIKLNAEVVLQALVNKQILEEQLVTVTKTIFKDNSYGSGTDKKVFNKELLIPIIDELLSQQKSSASKELSTL